MGKIAAHCWFHTHLGREDAAPPRAKVLAMLATIEGALRELDATPTALTVEAWPMPPSMRPQGEDCLARITITCAAGAMLRPLASWYEWQDPRWQWSARAHPSALEVVIGAATLPALAEAPA